MGSFDGLTGRQVGPLVSAMPLPCPLSAALIG